MARSHSRDHLYRQATTAALTGLAMNLILAVVKLAAGIIGHSFALIADAVNSIGDVLTSTIVLFALRMSQKPPDAEHPYGHSRAEAIAGTSIAILILVSALLVGWEALRRWSSLHEIPPAWTLWVAGSNVVIKESLYRYKLAVWRRTGSSALLANGWDHRSDALCSLAVLIGLAVVRAGGDSMIWADEAAALTVVVIICWSTIHLYRTCASELLDRQADDTMLRDVEATALKVPHVRRVETLWIRKSGMEYLADMHIEVDPDLTVRAGHAIGHEVKDRVLDRFVSIRDVLVHLEPHEATGLDNDHE